LRDVLQDRFDPKKLPPITKWQNELSDKTPEKDTLYREYYNILPPFLSSLQVVFLSGKLGRGAPK